jgi:hypothetical protein
MYTIKGEGNMADENLIEYGGKLYRKIGKIIPKMGQLYLTPVSGRVRAAEIDFTFEFEGVEEVPAPAPPLALNDQITARVCAAPAVEGAEPHDENYWMAACMHLLDCRKDVCPKCVEIVTAVEAEREA